jgi:chemosensory pili system protein ChpA (sensor histidine kinase/response regulator)
MHPDAVTAGETAAVEPDLGPLAWVLDELRKSLDGAVKALKRFVRDAELALGSDLAALDASQLRIARQQLHQAVGALEMVGLEIPAKVLRATEALTQKFIARPEICSVEAAATIERVSFALTDYLEGLLKGKAVSSVALFPQYRDVMDGLAADRVHPADLWAQEWRWHDVNIPDSVAPLAYDFQGRSRINGHVLNVVKIAYVPSARALAEISLGFAAGQSALQPRVFWALAAAYFEVVALGLCPADVYTKRAASRVLSQYRTLARGEPEISERLVQDLLFFCAQANPGVNQRAPALRAVRAAYGLESYLPVDYAQPQFGRFDPAVLALARKRISAATETWSALSGGDTQRIKAASDQFSLVTESIIKLHPDSRKLAVALTRAMDAVAHSGKAPQPALAMEVATSVLYLEAAYDDMDLNSEDMVERSHRLAQRLDLVIDGAPSEPLDSWMEELYRRVSDRQIMGSVVDELRVTLNEVETSLDTYFRRPDERLPLHEVPGMLAQMRGVFSVLGLDQAALAALRMRDQVELALSADEQSPEEQIGVFEKFGNSLGAMGFLIDMLSYQRELAKRLFVYDEVLGEFRSLMGRRKTPHGAPVTAAAPLESIDASPRPKSTFAELSANAASGLMPLQSVPASVSGTASVVSVPPAVEVSEEDDDIELRQVFLDEAQEVIDTGMAAVMSLHVNPGDLEQQTSLRRAFHTLKGSSRMVGLNGFGEAAWAMEQLLNAWLPQQKPVSPELVRLAGQAVTALGQWVDDVGAGTDAAWSAEPFRQAADKLRLHNLALDLTEMLSSTAKATEPLAGLVEVRSNDLAQVPELAQETAQALLEEAAETTVTPWQDSANQMPDTVLRDPMASTRAAPLETPPLPKATPEIAESDASPVAEDDFYAYEPADFETTEMVGFESTEMQDPWANVEESMQSLDQDLAQPKGAEAPESDAVAAEIMQPEPALPVSDTTPIESEPLAAALIGATDAAVQEELDEQVKVIGDLRIGIPLYNVYLNEADEWSRRLLTELSEWSLELESPVPDAAIGLAHSLAGSSATVGFMALSEVARALEHALEHVQLGGVGLPEHGSLFVAVAEDIRRLLHQFAAGFLKEPDPEHLPALRAVLDMEVSSISLGLDDLAPMREQDQEPPSANEFKQVDEGGDVSLDDLIPEPAAESLVLPELLDKSPVPEKALDLLAQDMVAQDHLDVDLFPIFEEEALELLPQLSSALRQWSARPDNLGARQEALRVLHTLKGSARLAGAMRLGEMSHQMESAIEQVELLSSDSPVMHGLLSSLDELTEAFETLRKTPIQALSLPELGVARVVEALPELLEDAMPQSDIATAAPPMPVVRSVATATPLLPPRRTVGQNIRVRSQLIDRMVNQAGEVMISRSRLESRLGQLRGSLDELTGNLDRLRRQLRDLELQSESQMQSRFAHTKDVASAFDPLEFDRFTRVQELTRMMAESVHDVATVQRSLQQTVAGVEDDLIAQGRQTRELQRDLLRSRMVEFDSISERLYGVVRQAAKDVDKQVKLDIIGGSMEMDRGVLDRVAAAFEHLLRNAVAHGIEYPQAREAAGKPTTGDVVISLTQQSNDVVVTFKDDGAGLNLERIRQKAIEQGLLSAYAQASDAELSHLIFATGLSTADGISELAGRGIGMDVVRNEVNALGGRIDVASQSGVGTQFTLVLPLTTAVTQVVLLRMGEVVMGVPSGLVELVRRLPTSELAAAYQSKTLGYKDEAVPFYWAGSLLQGSRASVETPGKTASVAIFRSAGQRVAMHVDEVLGNQEVVVKNLGPQLAKLPGLAGMTVLASGAVVLIYNPVALAITYGEQAQAFSKASDVASVSGEAGSTVAVPTAAMVPLVLVVDDSITVRRVTQRLLKREGFRVALATDGLQALEVLQLEKPSVVLTDIEMPRMDGFDLVRNIRADAKLMDLPIIMITSRIAEKHRDYARELKVNNYLGKPYPEDELIALVRQYCGLDVVA